MSELKLTPAQQTAAIDSAGESMALRSGAGCGKTFVLARRYAQLLDQADADSAPLRRLVALTFTDKAALEMSQRVRKMLLDEAKDASGPRKAQLRDWVDELPEARISTIHSFCASLLRAHAIEAGVDPNFAVCADGLLTAKLLDDACDSAMLAAAEAGDEKLTALLEQLAYPAVLELLTRLVSERHLIDPNSYRDADDVLAGWGKLIDNLRAAAWARLDNDAALASMARSISAQPCSDPGDKLAIKRLELMSVVDEIIADAEARTAEKFQFAVKYTIGNVGGKAAWGSKEAAMDLRHQIKAVKEALDKYAPYAETLNEMDRGGRAGLAGRRCGEAIRIDQAGPRIVGLQRSSRAGQRADPIQSPGAGPVGRRDRPDTHRRMPGHRRLPTADARGAAGPGRRRADQRICRGRRQAEHLPLPRR